MKRKLDQEEFRSKRRKLDDEATKKHDELDDLAFALSVVEDKMRAEQKELEAKYGPEIKRLNNLVNKATVEYGDIELVHQAYEIHEHLTQAGVDAVLIEFHEGDLPKYVKTVNELFGGYIPCNGYILLCTKRDYKDGGWKLDPEFDDPDLDEDERMFGNYVAVLPEGINDVEKWRGVPDWEDNDPEDWEPNIEASLADSSNLSWEDDKRGRTYYLAMRVETALLTLKDIPGKVPFKGTA